MAKNGQIQTLPVGQGGTGLSSLSTGQILYASGSTTISTLGPSNNSFIVTNASGVPSFGTTLPTGTFQSQTSASWTPADASGASLTFTINSATYTQIGNIIILNASITYPSTASTVQGKISGLPVAPHGDICGQANIPAATQVAPIISVGAGLTTMVFWRNGNPNTIWENTYASTLTMYLNLFYST